MGALVMKYVEFAVGAANHHDGLTGEVCAKIIAGLFDLAFVADVYPRVAKDALQFKLEYIRVGIKRPMHASGLDQ